VQPKKNSVCKAVIDKQMRKHGLRTGKSWAPQAAVVLTVVRGAPRAPGAAVVDSWAPQATVVLTVVRDLI
jgi:hypothetical protein